MLMSEALLKYIQFTHKKYVEKNNILGVYLLFKLHFYIKRKYPETRDSIINAIKSYEEKTIDEDDEGDDNIVTYLFDNVEFQNELLYQKIEENIKLRNDLKNSTITFPTEAKWYTTPDPFLPPSLAHLSDTDSKRLNEIYEKCKYCHEKKDYIGVYLLNETIRNIYNNCNKEKKEDIDDIIISDVTKHGTFHPLTDYGCFFETNEELREKTLKYFMENSSYYFQ